MAYKQGTRLVYRMVERNRSVYAEQLADNTEKGRSLLI